jgi:hypothetical protein
MKRCACLALAAATLAACGGDGVRLSRDQYEAKLKSAFAAARAEIGPVRHTPGSVDLLTRIGNSYGGIAAALRGLRVPANVQRLNDRLVAAASAKATGLKRLVAKLDRASSAERQRLLAEYAFDLSDFDSAVAALGAKGYRFRPSAGT